MDVIEEAQKEIYRICGDIRTDKSDRKDVQGEIDKLRDIIRKHGGIPQ